MQKLTHSLKSHQRGATGQILALFLVALIFTALVAAVIGFQVGYRQGTHAIKSAMPTAVMDTGELSAQNTQLKEQLETITQERDISIGNFERLHQEQEALKTKNLQLEQVNELLKSSVASQGGVALNILGSQIASLPDNTFEYRFDVAMLDVSGKAVKMVPKLTLLNATSMVEIPLQPSSYDINGVANIRGRFVMPEGFTPKQIKIQLTAGSQKVEQLYNWQVGQVVKDAPESVQGATDKRPISSN